jgi:hypothetical protein
MKSVLTRQGNGMFRLFAREVAVTVGEIEKQKDEGLRETGQEIMVEFQRVLDDVCAGSMWKNVCSKVGYAYREAVEEAIDIGLQKSVNNMLA